MVKGCSVARHVQKDSLSVSSFGREKAAFAWRQESNTAAPSRAEILLVGAMLTKVTRAGDRRKTIRRRLIRLFDYTNAALSNKLFDSVDKETVGSDQNTAGFEHGAKLARLLEVEQELALAGRAGKDGVEFV